MKIYQKTNRKVPQIRTLILALCAAAALCLAGCGSDRALVLVPEGESTSEVSDSGETGAPGSADGAAGAGVPETEEPQAICVYVCGAVATPGVVELPAGSRACDALDAAGGLTADADERSVNLAAVLEDGQQLYFPTTEEAETQRESAEAESSGLVNINTADAAQLCTLPGIGESRAAAIIAYREEHGDFAAPEDVMAVSGIKTAAYEKIKAYITVK